MKEILRTKNKWVAGTCFIVGLMLVLMLSTAVFFFVTLGLLDLRGPEWWLYAWQYLTYRWMKRHTTWWTELTEEEKKDGKEERL